jgi:hypothetical protein
MQYLSNAKLLERLVIQKRSEALLKPQGRLTAQGTAMTDFRANGPRHYGPLGRGYERGFINATGLNFMLSVVKGIEARDQVEAALAAQMAAVQMATMTFAWQLAHLDNIAQQDSAERAFNRLAQIFAAQIEALK